MRERKEGGRGEDRWRRGWEGSWRDRRLGGELKSRERNKHGTCVLFVRQAGRKDEDLRLVLLSSGSPRIPHWCQKPRERRPDVPSTQLASRTHHSSPFRSFFLFSQSPTTSSPCRSLLRAPSDADLPVDEIHPPVQSEVFQSRPMIRPLTRPVVGPQPRSAVLPSRFLCPVLTALDDSVTPPERRSGSGFRDLEPPRRLTTSESFPSERNPRQLLSDEARRQGRFQGAQRCFPPNSSVLLSPLEVWHGVRRVEKEIDGEDEGEGGRRRFLAAGGEDKGLAAGLGRGMTRMGRGRRWRGGGSCRFRLRFLATDPTRAAS